MLSAVFHRFRAPNLKESSTRSTLVLLKNRNPEGENESALLGRKIHYIRKEQMDFFQASDALITMGCLNFQLAAEGDDTHIHTVW